MSPREALADTSTNTPAALKKFESGRTAFDAGKFEEALLAFQSSYDLSPSPNSRLYVARCYRALGKVASAFTAFRLAAREAQDRLTTTGERRYSATRDTATTEAAELEPKVARVSLAVPAGVPPGFLVKMNGAEVPNGAWGVAVETDAGDVAVEATGPRLVPYRERFRLKDGEQRRVEIRAARVPTGTIVLTLTSRPAGLAVELDGTPLDVGDLEKPRDVDVGPHEVRARAPGYSPFLWRAEVHDEQRAEATVRLNADERLLGGGGTPSWLFFAVAGGAVAALATGSILAVHANGQQSTELAKDPFARDPAVRDSIKSQSTIANVLFVSGGVLGVGAVTLAFMTRWKRADASATALRLTPWVSPSFAGIGADARF